MKYRVWGIGMSRTGTTSLTRALRILGYENIIHNPTFEELRHLNAGTDIGCSIFYKYLDADAARNVFETVKLLLEMLPVYRLQFTRNSDVWHLISAKDNDRRIHVRSGG